MQPVIHQHHGFIDKYIGDAIMALFSGDADNAVQAGIAMLQKLTEYNQHRQRSGYVPIQIGIGIHTGTLMLGTVGGEERMDGTVISDAVNLASRSEGMTKMYGATLLITEHTYSRLRNVSQYALREIDKVKVKGKTQPVRVYEVFDGESPERIALKRQTLATFTVGLTHYRTQDFTAAITDFQQVLQMDAEDQAAQLYLKRSEYLQQHGVTEGWEGVAALESK
jgi:class 3 adenylate cyclase